VADQENATVSLAYTIAEASKESNTGRTKIYDEINSGRLRAVKIGRRTLILHNDLRAWLASLPTLKNREAAAA